MTSTEPWRQLLDTDAARNTASASSDALSLLREIVNYSTHLWAACSAVKPELPDAGLAPNRLFYHVIEMADAIEVELHDACTVAAQIHFRSAWEAGLQLQFMVRQQSLTDAGLAWLVCSYRQSLVEADALLQLHRTKRKRLKTPTPTRVEIIAQEQRDSLRARLRQPHLKAFEQRIGKKDPWYKTFGGGANLEQLALALQRLEGTEGDTHSRSLEYAALYRPPSRLVHSSDNDRLVRRGADGRLELQPFRGTEGEIRLVAAQSVGVLLGVSSSIVQRLTPEMFPDVRAWYVARIQRAYLSLSKIPDWTDSQQD